MIIDYTNERANAIDYSLLLNKQVDRRNVSTPSNAS